MPYTMKRRLDQSQDLLVRLSAPKLKADLPEQGRQPLRPPVCPKATATIGEMMAMKGVEVKAWGVTVTL